MIRYLADTNILGYFVRGEFPMLHRRMLLALSRQELAISVITRAEIRLGLARMNADDKRLKSIGKLLEELPAMAWTAEAADRYGAIAARLMRTGQGIGEMDMMIGAHALVARLPLVTHNTRHFSRIPELTLEDWTV